MNNVTLALGTLIHYSVQIRDTLEYTLNRPTYDPTAFEARKRAVLVELDEPTPLKNIINNSGENGANLEKRIRDFHEKVYGESSTIIRNAADGLRVDHNQNLSIYEDVFFIHEQIGGMINGLIDQQRKAGVDLSPCDKLAAISDRMYRGVALLSLTATLVNLFQDFNKAMQETKGQPSPSSNFIGQDIGKVIQHINGVRANCRITDLKYKAVEDQVNAFCENVMGRRDLPAGKTFPDVIKATTEMIQAFVNDAEPKFKELYAPTMKAIVEASKEMAANKGNAPQPAKAEGAEGIKTMEIDPITGLPKA